jgi:cyclophilin family peptidyl-prolyl cis-trans isomerase
VQLRRRCGRPQFFALLVTVALALSVAACSGGGDDDPGAAKKGAPEGEVGTGECPPTDGSATRTIDFAEAPSGCIDPAKSYTATFDTSEGSFTVDLDTERTPKTVDNFVALARWKYYDGTKIFRTEADTGIAQGGSPHTEGPDDPGPGYTIEDEGGTFTTDDYGPGAFAMARGAEPNSASAQFFALSGEGGRYLGDAGQIGPSAGTYVVFGKVTEGLDVLKAITDLQGGIDQTTGLGVPSRDITVEKVTIEET